MCSLEGAECYTRVGHCLLGSDLDRHPHPPPNLALGLGLQGRCLEELHYWHLFEDETADVPTAVAKRFEAAAAADEWVVVEGLVYFESCD